MSLFKTIGCLICKCLGHVVVPADTVMTTWLPCWSTTLMWMRWQQNWSGCRCVACCCKPPPAQARCSTRPSSTHHWIPTRFSEEWPRSPSWCPSHLWIANVVSAPTTPSRRTAVRRLTLSYFHFCVYKTPLRKAFNLKKRQNWATILKLAFSQCNIKDRPNKVYIFLKVNQYCIQKCMFHETSDNQTDGKPPCKLVEKC